MEQELCWFKLAQEICLVFPQGTPVQPAPPAPDICFCNEGIGIEITTYLLGQGRTGSALRTVECTHEEIVKDAQSAFEAIRSEKVHVGVFWTSKGPIDPLARQMLIDGIAREVSNLLPHKNAIWRPDWSRPEDVKLGWHIGQIGILPTNESYWGCDEAGTVGDDVNRIKVPIAEKDAKVEKYRSAGCKKVWLLIVPSGEHISSTFSPDSDFDQATFRTRFDGVFVLDVFRKRVHELRVVKH